ncbi:MAG TPA: amidohydrolase family protein [Anaerolineae bacterium]|nr:amidohydrolase family protein [Anaerolineae bacterium]
MECSSDSKSRERVLELIDAAGPTRRAADLFRYAEDLESFLPDTIIDAHVHLWNSGCVTTPFAPERYRSTMLEVADGYSSASMHLTYRELLPGKKVASVCFGLAAFEADPERVNSMVATEEASVHARLLIPPSGAELDCLRQFLTKGGFVGLKPYPERTTRWHLKEESVGIGDFVTRPQWQLADELGLPILLHPPRARRMADPGNLRALESRLERWPRAKVVLAHLGATACPEGYARSLARLRRYPQVFFDTAMVCNSTLIRLVLDAVGPSRLIFGTDLPFALVRGQTVCRDGTGVLLTEGRYNFGVESGAPHAYLLYESLLATKAALVGAGLRQDDVRRIFAENAAGVYSAHSTLERNGSPQ